MAKIVQRRPGKNWVERGNPTGEGFSNVLTITKEGRQGKKIGTRNTRIRMKKMGTPQRMRRTTEI